MEEPIKEYAEYCLNCPAKPCSPKGCPLNNDIPAFIHQVKQENIKEAYKILSNTTVLGSVCGRICPHMKQCQGSCIRGIKGEPVNIGEIEAYVFDEALKNEWYREEKQTNELEGKKIAVVGGGPAGLTCSSFLARKGAKITIYEKYNELGGILAHGIPEFRLEKETLKSTVESILNAGSYSSEQMEDGEDQKAQVTTESTNKIEKISTQEALGQNEEANNSKIEVRYGMELGKNFNLTDLENSFDAIFLGFGANVSAKMNIEGEELEGVYGGNRLLERGEHPSYKGKKVAVIGGGNVAMDCSRTINRLGADKVYVIYRRAEKQMPAEVKEIEDAKREGVEFLFQNNIVKILGDKKVEKIECIKTQLVKKEGETREVPVNIENSNYMLDMDYVVMAVGSEPEKELVKGLGLELNKWGCINVDEKHRTSREKIFAGGDLAGDRATVAWAARAGRDAAVAIEEYLK